MNNDDRGLGTDKCPILTVVLLGWFGSETKHLRKYSELYSSIGIHTVTFVTHVSDVATLDFNGRYSNRLTELVSELANFLSEKEKDGRGRFLLFHNLSNAGWLS